MSYNLASLRILLNSVIKIMSNFSPRIVAVALCTFIVGVSVSLIWLAYYKDSRRVSDGRQPCVPRFDMQSVSEGKADYYFPQGTFDDVNVRHRVSSGLAEFFVSAKEPSLFRLSACVNESYRFSWFRTFRVPVIIRVWRSGDNKFLVIKQLSEMSGYGVGELTSENIRPLSESEWNNFLNLLNQSSYWSLPMSVETRHAYDPTLWVLEGVREQQYKIVIRENLDNEAYQRTCVYLLELAGLESIPMR